MREKKKTLRLFLSALVGIFSLAAGFTGAYAWFVMKLNQGVEGTEFSVSLKELQRAELSALLQNLDVIGFYHSHANFKAAASQKDKSFAIPDFSYPIVSVFNGKAIDVKSFSYNSNTGSGDKKENLTEEVIVCL